MQSVTTKHPAPTENCVFEEIDGIATVVYPPISKLYGLTDVPTEFQKISDIFIVPVDSTFSFIDHRRLVWKRWMQIQFMKVEE